MKAKREREYVIEVKSGSIVIKHNDGDAIAEYAIPDIDYVGDFGRHLAGGGTLGKIWREAVLCEIISDDFPPAEKRELKG